MATSDLPSKDEIELQLRKRIQELENANKKLAAEMLEYKKTEERLASQAQLLSKVREAVYSTDTNYIINYWNEAAEKLFGWTKEEALGKESGDLLKTKIESTTRAQEIPKLWEEGYWEGEVQYLRRDGAYLLVDVRATVLKDANGKETGIVSVAQDITECKRAEDELAAAQNQIQSIINNTPDIIYAFDLEERFMLANMAIANVLNSTPDQMIGKRRHEFMPKMDANWHEANDRKVLEAGKVLEFEEYSNLKDRSITWLTKKFPLRDAQGEIYAIAGISADITERKRSEEALRESEARYKVTEALEAERQRLFDVLDTLPVMICLITPDHHYAFTNRKFREKFGDCADKHCYECCFGFSKPCEFCEAFKVLKTGQPHYWEVTTPDGSIIDVHNFPFTDVDGSQLILEMDTDITESRRAKEKLQESEKKYRNIVETANEGMVIVNSNFKTIYVNKKMEELLGYTQEEIIGKSGLDFTDEEGKANINNGRKRIRKDIDEAHEFKFIRKDGSPLWTLVNAKPNFDKDGNFTGALMMYTDITKRKEAELLLQRIQVARQKEIHHRIKNNLQVISSLLDLQAEKFNCRNHIDSSEVLKAFKESQNRVMSVALIHEELHKGRETDKLNFSLYLQRLAESLFQTYRLEKANINLDLELEENIFFDMDTAVPLGMIVNEIITNSFKYAFSGKNRGEIQVKLQRNIENENSDYILTISDNGIGIPENLNFEAPDTLGLQLVNILVDQIDGEIILKRASGTEFTIFFGDRKENFSEPV